MTHGWPGSVVEFRKVIDVLTDPVAFGGNASDAFHLVCPTLPGYGFSGKPARPGWGVERIADAWDELMVRLGYPRYGAQGGDWGSLVAAAIGRRHPARVLGVHLNFVVAFPDPGTIGDLTEREQAALAAAGRHRAQGTGYAMIQSTRPQSIGYGLVDSPAALCAWIVEKFQAWSDCDGDPGSVFSREEMLDNIMLYWLGGSGASAARLYWESYARRSADPVPVPAGCSIFPREIYVPSRRWAEPLFTDLRYWNELDKGGHFAALEQPALFIDEVRSAFRAFRD
jgi:pimeloyl-ACP methyl ester carboxylesterase